MDLGCHNKMNIQSGLQEVDLASGSEYQNRDSNFRVSLIDLWHIARIRWRLIISIASGVLVLTAIVVFSLTPRYSGAAVVALNQQQNNTVNIPAILSGLPSDQPTILTQVEILQSDNLASRVVSKLKLDQDPEFNTDLRPSWFHVFTFMNPLNWLPSPNATLSTTQRSAQSRKKTIDNFLKRLSVTQLELSTAIQVSFESEDPAKAANIANALADGYLEGQLDTKFDAAQKATQWLSGRLGQLAAQANAADAIVERYKIDHHLTNVVGAEGSGSISVLDQQIATTNAQLMQAETDRAGAEATASRVAALVRDGHADEVSQVVTSPLIAQYRAQEAQLVEQLAQLSSRYGPDHPKMLDLQAEKRDLEAKIAEEVNNVVGTADNDVAIARSHESVLHAELSRLEGQSGEQGQDRIKLNELQANATSARMLYDTFVQRSKETQQEQGLLIPDARILSQAAIPTEPSFPKKVLVFGIAIPASILFGFMVAFIIERLDNGFRVASRAEETLGYPVFATLPDITAETQRSGKELSTNAADFIVDRPLSSFAEAIRGLQMGISLSNVDQAPRVIVVTSAIPGEGKTTTAMSLARHIAQTGQKVVIMDGDLRRPNVKTIAGIESGKLDLIDVLSGKCLLADALVPDSKSGATLLPAYRHVKNAPDLIESRAMSTMISQLRASYDYVIIDSAPVLPVNDTKILSRLADAVVFIVQWEQTPRTAAYDAVKALREIHAPIIGIVLTRADTKRFHYYSFGYSGYYYSYSKYYDDRAAT